MQTYNDKIYELLQDKTISLIGFADLCEVPADARLGLPYGICIGVCPWTQRYIQRLQQQ